MQIIVETLVSASYLTVYNGMDRSLLEKLKPPLGSISLERFDGSKKGDRVELTVKHLGIFPQYWEVIISSNWENEKEAVFVDQGLSLPWPLTFWEHHHICMNSNGQTIIRDDVQFKTVSPFFDRLLKPMMKFVFKSRKNVYQEVFGKP